MCMWRRAQLIVAGAGSRWEVDIFSLEGKYEDDRSHFRLIVLRREARDFGRSVQPQHSNRGKMWMLSVQRVWDLLSEGFPQWKYEDFHYIIKIQHRRFLTRSPVIVTLTNPHKRFKCSLFIFLFLATKNQLDTGNHSQLKPVFFFWA